MSARTFGPGRWLLALCLAGCGKADGEIDFTPKGNGGDDVTDAGNPFGNADDTIGGNPLADGGDLVLPDGGLNIDCGAKPFDATQVKANLLIVLDKSGSMNDTPSGFADDKWTAMRGALETSLAAVQDNLGLGIDLYPVSSECVVPGDDEVQVPIEEGATALPKILDAIDATSPGGGTPTAQALARARRYFTDGAGADLDGDAYVLLATDGGPNCNDGLTCDADACTVNLDGDCPGGVPNCCAGAGGGCLDDVATAVQVQRLADAGIATVVVGIPGSEDYAGVLDTLAEAGGRPNTGGPTSYFAVSEAGTGAGGLTGVLESITRGLITSCKFQLDSDPPDVNKLNLEIDGKVVPMKGADGWTLDESTSPPTLIIQGATCDRVEQQGAQSVVITFGCPTIVG